MVATGSGGLEEHMARFTLPRDLYHGKGALEALKDFEGKRAMICVGGGSMKRFGFLDRAKQYLEKKRVWRFSCLRELSLIHRWRR